MLMALWQPCHIKSLLWSPAWSRWQIRISHHSSVKTKMNRGGSTQGGWKDERSRRETARECQSDERTGVEEEGWSVRKVGMKGCEKNAIPRLENERGSEKRTWREEEKMWVINKVNRRQLRDKRERHVEIRAMRVDVERDAVGATKNGEVVQVEGETERGEADEGGAARGRVDFTPDLVRNTGCELKGKKIHSKKAWLSQRKWGSESHTQKSKS